MRSHALLRLATGVAVLAGVGTLWFFLAPAQIGGGVDYVVIHGVSMEPKLHSGDLAVLRPAPSYSVGEVAGYHSGLLHEVVLHRIVATRGPEFVFKGDNNDFIDSYYPTRSQLVGTLWFHVPGVGRALLWLHVPIHAAIAAALLALLLGSGLATGTRRRRRPSRPAGAPAVTPRSARPFHPDPASLAAVGAAQALVILFGALAFVAYGRSSTHPAPVPSAYEQTGRYAYSASLPVSSVYPTGHVRTGDPVYMNIVHSLTLAYHYRLDSTLPHTVGGRLGLVVSLRSSGGWKRTLASAPPRLVAGDSASVSVPVDLRTVERDLTAFARETAVTNETFTLVVSPRPRLHGLVAGQAVPSPQPKPLTFAVDELALTVAGPAPRQLSTSTTGSVTEPRPASLSLLKLRMGVTTARLAGVVGAPASAVALLAALAVLWIRAGADELTVIRRRYGAWLVPVTSPLVGPKVVDVASMESLVGLAEHYERAILHEEHDGAHAFGFEEDGTLFRYRLGGDESQFPGQWPLFEAPDADSAVESDSMAL